MGITYVEATVTGPEGTERLSFLVDSGATYTVLPEKSWRSIGLSPTRSVRFTLADGTVIERDVSEARLTLPVGTAHSPGVRMCATGTASG